MEGFSAKQEKALAALISEPSIAAAAAKAGVGETTMFRWLKDAAFTAEYRRLRRDAVEQSLSQIQSATSEAVQTLRDHLQCEHPATAVRAAQIILDQAVKGVEILDLQERLEQIENAIEKQDNQGGKNLSLDSELCQCEKEVRFVINPGEVLNPQNIHKPYESKPDEFRPCLECGRLERIVYCTFNITAPREA